ncbi:hypothetical protein X798_06794 [Onchocerca flexuosa]|uniref:Uncharacterized protein n=1 Tax=Onchocerca flexuosa TaxID=387005 RepID=A0A238BNS5_9BILA|nr:hypothetical protein X798_06794 [Onchocerca flexuosa]
MWPLSAETILPYYRIMQQGKFASLKLLIIFSNNRTSFIFIFATFLQHCSQKCSKISSFELRNLQVLSSKTERIRKFSISKPLDTNLRINYYDVEMTGMSPAFCGNYSTFEMPTYSVKESKSKGFQFLHKLYFQSYRDVYTHSMCNSQCVFDCRQVGYDAEIMTELLLRNIPDLHVYQCDRYHNYSYCLMDIPYIMQIRFHFLADEDS